MSALRTTWQVSREDDVYPNLGGGTTMSVGMVVVGTYIGDQVDASQMVMQQNVGVPFVQVDVIAFLPVSADVRAGDTLIDLERGARYLATGVNTYTERTIVSLKQSRNRSNKVVG